MDGMHGYQEQVLLLHHWNVSVCYTYVTCKKRAIIGNVCVCVVFQVQCVF